MTDQPTIEIESLKASADSIGYELRDRAGGGWNIYIKGTDFIVSWFDTKYALAKFLALGGAPETQS